NPVLCAAALATIDVIETHGLVTHARDLGRTTLERLKEMQTRHPLIGDVRGLGLFLGIELVKDRRTRERASEEAEAVMYAALSRGLSFKTTMGNILTLTPALTITREEMDRALAILEDPGGQHCGGREGITEGFTVSGTVEPYPQPQTYALIFAPFGSTSGRSAT
ncbi:MAG: aminotransferase class III-fold pyridoxal phosphate-dependent enzyme, partial [Desulfobacterales bacterium]|nr:aminotransferase class III-fold pyridoxal phosphate-dependent enzyme [Desulfobacterales bacterium]